MSETRNIDLHQLKAIVAKLGSLGGNLDLVKAVKAGGFVLEGQAKINATGTFSSKATNGPGLAGSISTKVTKQGPNEAEVAVGPTVEYGRIQELGGTVLPVHAKMLHWLNENGEDVFANVVHLPPRPYLRPAAQDHKDEIFNAVKETLADEIRGALGI